MKKKNQHLVCQHLEMLSSKALEDYQDILRSYVRHRHGIYALYRKGKLVYVGLAKNLRSRLHHHLRDRHADKWDRFSVYLTIESDHIRELEALVIRIAAPRANRQKGRLKKSQDLKRAIRRSIKQSLAEKMRTLFWHKPEIVKLSKKASGRAPKLAGYFTKGTKLRFSFKNRMYRAYAKKNGSIRYNGRIYNSPSLAAMAVVRRSADGWHCWKYERSPGEWVTINELRK